MKLNHISYPLYPSEFEVQSCLYQKLFSLGYDARGCVQARCSDGNKQPRVYFDIVVFDLQQNAIAVIEVKNNEFKESKEIGRRQTFRYQQFGVPLLVCQNMGQVDSTIEELRSYDCAFPNPFDLTGVIL